MRDLNDLCYFVQVVPRVQDRLETHAPGLTASLATKATETSKDAIGRLTRRTGAGRAVNLLVGTVVCVHRLLA